MIYNETRYNSQWSTKKLSQLGDFARGKSKHRPRNDKRLFENGKYPLVQTGDIKAADLYITAHTQEYGDFGLQQSKLWDTGTLCITIAANIAETAILSYPMCFPDSVVGFTAYPAESSALFMHYVFTYIRNSIQKSTSGSIQDNINIDYLENLDFKIPIKDYQDKIVAVLGTIDKKIALNKRINVELEAMAKTLYDYWFVQFDFPDENGKPYRTSGGAMEWNEQLKREIPKGWKVDGLSSILQLLKDGTHNPPPRIDRGIPLLTGTMFDSLFLCYDKATYIDDVEYHRIHSAYEPKTGDVLLTKIGTVGSVNYLCNQDIPIAIHCNSALLRFQESYSGPYGLWMMKSNLFQARLRAVIGQSIQEFVSLERLGEIKIEIVPPKLAGMYSSLLQSNLQMLQNIRMENLEFTRLRDWLLPMLMNGQATVE